MKRICLFALVFAVNVLSQGTFTEGQRLEATWKYNPEWEAEGPGLSFRVYYQAEGVTKFVTTQDTVYLLPVITADVTVWCTAVDTANNESARSNQVFMDFIMNSTEPVTPETEYVAGPDELLSWKIVVRGNHQVYTDDKGKKMLRHYPYNSRSVKQKDLYLMANTYQVSCHGQAFESKVVLCVDGKEFGLNFGAGALIRLEPVVLGEGWHAFSLDVSSDDRFGLVNIYEFRINRYTESADTDPPSAPVLEVRVVD